MKVLLSYTSIFAVILSCQKMEVLPQSNIKAQTNTTRTAESDRDKIILKRNGQKTFIVSDKDSKYYEKRRNFSFDEYDWSSFQRTYGELKNLKDFNLKDFPRRWVLLVQYKGKFYTYLPCDFCSDYIIQFSDQLVLENTCEGIIASKIDKFIQKDVKSYNVQFAERKIDIHLLSKMPGVAIFEEDGNYDLMVDVHFIENYDLIKNECLQGKVHELTFEQPDFEKLLKN